MIFVFVVLVLAGQKILDFAVVCW